MAKLLAAQPPVAANRSKNPIVAKSVSVAESVRPASVASRQVYPPAVASVDDGIGSVNASGRGQVPQKVRYPAANSWSAGAA